MRSFFRSLNILHWPIWVKLSAGFVFAIAISVGIVAYVTQTGYQSVGQQNLQAYIEERGDQQRATILESVNQADQAIEDFLTTTTHRPEILRLLSDETHTLIGMKNVGEVFQNILVGSQLFNKIRLVNLDGDVTAQATPERIQFSIIFKSDTPAFTQAQNALLQDQDHSLVVFNNPTTMEVSYVVRNEEGVPSGFIIGTLNNAHVFYDELTSTNATYPVYSYLVTVGQDPIIIATDDALEQALFSAENSDAVNAALNGETGTRTYNIGNKRDTAVIGHYTPIYAPDQPDLVLFALVTEAKADTPLIQASSYFSGTRIFPIVVGLIVFFLLLVVLFNQLITPSLLNLRTAIQAVARGDFNHPVKAASRDDEIGAVGAAFVDMRVQVRHLLDDLETRVAARTRDISATQEISRYAATQHNLQTLLDQVVQLIVERFPNIYHAQIFLLDQERLYAVLRASTGEPGKLLLARGHRLAVGSVSVIGQVIDQKQTIIARDTATSQVHRRNEFLPDTHAELAIPLRVADHIIGALDVQSKYRNAFTEDEVSILETMADQIAVAIENARLYQESVRRLEDIERANREATIATWREYIYGQRQRQLLSEAGTRTGMDMSDLRQRAIAEGRIIAGEPTNHNTIPVAVPIQLRGQILGAVEWELPIDDMSDNKLQLAQELANRLAVSLENARLFEESQRATERERIVNSIAAKLTPQTEVSEILQTAVREVGQALRAPQVSIRLHNANSNGSNGTNGHSGNGSNGTNGSNGSHD
jgi:GAF domain-containing protein/HAMP domain-containing protein